MGERRGFILITLCVIGLGIIWTKHACMPDDTVKIRLGESERDLVQDEQKEVSVETCFQEYDFRPTDTELSEELFALEHKLAQMKFEFDQLQVHLAALKEYRAKEKMRKSTVDSQILLELERLIKDPAKLATVRGKLEAQARKSQQRIIDSYDLAIKDTEQQLGDFGPEQKFTEETLLGLQIEQVRRLSSE